MKYTFISVIILASALIFSACSPQNALQTVQVETPVATLQEGVINLSDGSVTIHKSGVYTLVGELKEGSVIVEVDTAIDKGLVTLILSDAHIHSNTQAPIHIISAKAVELVLEEGTQNSISQGVISAETLSDGFPSAAIYSKSDLTISGEGTLRVSTLFNDGITSKDRLTILSGVITLETQGDALTGKDELTISGGEITIQTRGGYAGVIKANRFNNGTGGRGQTTLSVDLDGSHKGLKSEGDISISGGLFTLSTYEDAIHSDGNVTITGGEFVIEAGDDGIHADGSVLITGGLITIKSSYEGIEGLNVTLEGGTISIVSDDDGINVTEPTGTLRISGGEIFIQSGGDGIDSNGNLEILGGTLTVDTSTIGNADQAIDFDGTLTFTGGVIVNHMGEAIDPSVQMGPGGQGGKMPGLKLPGGFPTDRPVSPNRP